LPVAIIIIIIIIIIIGITNCSEIGDRSCSLLVSTLID